MTSTVTAAFLPSPRRYNESIAAELRQVPSGSRRHRRYQQLVDGVSLELRRGEVTTGPREGHALGELHRRLRGVTDRLLAQTLHTLEADRLVLRKAGRLSGCPRR